METEKIFPGISLFEYGLNNSMLIAVTEKRTKEEIDKYVDAAKSFSITN